jgi:hypothetical protein
MQHKPFSDGRPPAYVRQQTRKATAGTWEPASVSLMPGRLTAQSKDEDHILHPRMHWPGWRMMLLGIILTEGTVGLLLGVFFLCVDGALRVSLPALTPPASMLPLALLGGGGSAGILLGIVLSHALQRKRLTAPAERRMASGAYPRAPSQRLVLPEPVDRAGALFTPAGETDAASWMVPPWDGEQLIRKHTETLEATQMRQRLRTLPLSYTEGVLGERKTDQLYQIQRVGSNILFLKDNEQ